MRKNKYTPANWFHIITCVVGYLFIFKNLINANKIIAVFCLYISDLQGGLLHYAFDNIDEDTILKYFVKEFHLHHEDPIFIARKNFMINTSMIFIFHAIHIALLNLYFYVGIIEYSDTYMKILSYKILFAIYGEYSHRMAHMQKKSYITSIAQKYGLLLSPKTHYCHHQNPRGSHSSNNFCQIGIANPVVNYLVRLINNKCILYVALFLIFYDYICIVLICQK